MRCGGGQAMIALGWIPVPWGFEACILKESVFYWWGWPGMLLHLPCPPQYNAIKKWLEVDVAPDIRGRIPLLLTSLSFKVSVWVILGEKIQEFPWGTKSPEQMWGLVVWEVFAVEIEILTFLDMWQIFMGTSDFFFLILPGSETSRQDVPGWTSPKGHCGRLRRSQGFLVSVTHRCEKKRCLEWRGAGEGLQSLSG